MYTRGRNKGMPLPIMAFYSGPPGASKSTIQRSQATLDGPREKSAARTTTRMATGSASCTQANSSRSTILTHRKGRPICTQSIQLQANITTHRKERPSCTQLIQLQVKRHHPYKRKAKQRHGNIRHRKRHPRTTQAEGPGGRVHGLVRASPPPHLRGRESSAEMWSSASRV